MRLASLDNLSLLTVLDNLSLYLTASLRLVEGKFERYFFLTNKIISFCYVNRLSNIVIHCIKYYCSIIKNFDHLSHNSNHLPFLAFASTMLQFQNHLQLLAIKTNHVINVKVMFKHN